MQPAPIPPRMLEGAIKRLPFLNYVIGVVLIMAVVATALVWWKLSGETAVKGGFWTIIGAIALVILRVMAALPIKALKIPAIILAYTISLLIAASCCLIFTGVFFGVPRDLQWLGKRVPGPEWWVDRPVEIPP